MTTQYRKKSYSSGIPREKFKSRPGFLGLYRKKEITPFPDQRYPPDGDKREVLFGAGVPNTVAILIGILCAGSEQKTRPGYRAGKPSGEIPEGALPHPDRVPEQLSFLNKTGNREGECPGYML